MEWDFLRSDLTYRIISMHSGSTCTQFTCGTYFLTMSTTFLIENISPSVSSVCVYVMQHRQSNSNIQDTEYTSLCYQIHLTLRLDFTDRTELRLKVTLCHCYVYGFCTFVYRSCYKLLLFEVVIWLMICYSSDDNHKQHSCATVLQATSHSYGESQNLTLRNFVLPGPIFTKLGTIDYIGDPY